MSEPELLTTQEQLLRSICCELFSIWQEAKSNYPDNWNGVLYDALPDKHKWEYELTANRILAKCEASFPARIAEAKKEWLKEITKFGVLRSETVNDKHITEAVAEERAKVIQEIDDLLMIDIDNASFLCIGRAKWQSIKEAKMAWFSGDPDPAYENAQEKAFEDLERKRTAAKKAEFPYESLKADLDKLPIYTQSELAARIAEARKEVLEHLITYWGEKDEFVIVAHFRYLLKQLEVKP